MDLTIQLGNLVLSRIPQHLEKVAVAHFRGTRGIRGCGVGNSRAVWRICAGRARLASRARGDSGALGAISPNAV
jgi:hypothetical protein